LPSPANDRRRGWIIAWALAHALLIVSTARAQLVSLPPVTEATDEAIDSRSLESIVAELAERVETLETQNAWLRGCESDACDGPTRDDCDRCGQDDCGGDCGPGSRARAVEINFKGRLHVDVWTFPGDSPGVNAFETGDATISPQDRLEIRRARLGADGTLFGNILYELELEFADANDAEFRDLYFGWDNLPVLQRVLLGNQKRPYALDQLNSSNQNVFMERAMIAQAFNANNRRFGLQSYGVTADEAWNWRYGVFNLREMQSDGLYSSDNWQMEMAARLARTLMEPRAPQQYLHAAVAANYAEPDGDPKPGRAPNQAFFMSEPEASTEMTWLDTGTIAGADRYSLLGLESVVNLGRFQVAGEYMNLWLDRQAGFGDSVYLHGGYIYLALFLTDHYQPWNRRLGIIDRITTLDPRRADDWRCLGAWQIALRWSYADLADSNIAGGIGESLTLGLNWYWTPRARMQLNAIYGNITDHFPVDGQTFGDYVILGTRAMVDF